MDYSVGDRVEVLWHQKLCPAEVRAVYTNGKVDVVYDADASAGYLLSEAEHGLNKMWMPKNKGKGGGGGENAKVCSVDGCSNNVRRRGLCGAHGRKPCSIEGCTTKAKARGLCNKHGANGKCVTMGCVTNAEKRGGHCKKHSQKVACAHPNCSTPLIPGKGVCTKHGAFGICTAWGCKSNACEGKKGLCFKHSKDKPTCSTLGCSNIVKARGVCRTHGAYGFCSTAGCGSGAIKDGLCTKHGIKKICTFDDCTTAAQARGLCVRHGGGSRKACNIDGCKTLAASRSRCTKHGANGWCKVDRCTTPAAPGFEHCIKHGGGKKKKRKPCSMAGCTNPSRSTGLCSSHGGGRAREECRIAGCTNKMYGFLKTCQTHGGSGYCQHPSGCNTPATKYGANCYTHSKKEKKD
eukprot:gene23087-biopygen25435